MPKLLTLTQLREVVQTSIEDIAAWCAVKPRLFELPRPEQQIQFELAARLREALRERTGNPTWDRLSYDGSDPVPQSFAVGSRPPILIDTRQLFGSIASGSRHAAEPDVALAVHVLRTSRPAIDIDENGMPSGQAFLPRSLVLDGALVEERVQQFERLSYACSDGALVVFYSNEARRKTVVESREVASWASWQTPLDTLWWTVRHFRAKAR